MEVKFYWREERGEGAISQADRKRLLDTDWVTAADFLSDVIFAAQALYDEVLEQPRGASRGD
jgi:hypothetical protein